MKKKVLLFFCVLIVYLYASFTVVQLGEFGFISSCVLFQLIIIYFYYRTKTSNVLKTTLISFFIIHFAILVVGVSIKGIDRLRLGYNYFIISYIISIIVGYFIARSATKNKTISIGIIFNILVIFSSTTALTLANQLDFYGTYIGEQNYKPAPNDILVDDYKNSKPVSLAKMNKKIVVIDFWNTYCSPCYEKFPLFAKLAQKYANNKNIKFVSINSYEDHDEYQEGKFVIDSLNYSFPTYFQKRKNTIKLKVNMFPTVLVIKENKVIFNGNLETLQMLDFYYLK